MVEKIIRTLTPGARAPSKTAFADDTSSVSDLCLFSMRVDGFAFGDLKFLREERERCGIWTAGSSQSIKPGLFSLWVKYIHVP